MVRRRFSVLRHYIAHRLLRCADSFIFATTIPNERHQRWRVCTTHAILDVIRVDCLWLFHFTTSLILVFVFSCFFKFSFQHFVWLVQSFCFGGHEPKEEILVSWTLVQSAACSKRVADKENMNRGWEKCVFFYCFYGYFSGLFISVRIINNNRLW